MKILIQKPRDIVGKNCFTEAGETRARTCKLYTERPQLARNKQCCCDQKITTDVRANLDMTVPPVPFSVTWLCFAVIDVEQFDVSTVMTFHMLKNYSDVISSTQHSYRLSPH